VAGAVLSSVFGGSAAVCLLAVLFAACSFNYGEAGAEEAGPDIVMRDVEYVRVENGDPLVRFRAGEAERWEKRQTMELDGFSFEQFENSGEDVNAKGSAGAAHVELSSGNIDMTETVRLEVSSEDFTLETAALSWQDAERRLYGGADDVVDIQRSDGTFFRGGGFSADIRSRTWTFSGGVEGSWVYEEEAAEEEEQTDDG
jgi:LPS export ABC transporter protein LptC